MIVTFSKPNVSGMGCSVAVAGNADLLPSRQPVKFKFRKILRNFNYQNNDDIEFSAMTPFENSVSENLNSENLTAFNYQSKDDIKY